MLHLILFGYMENIRSLRALKKACRTDIRFMYIGDNIKQSFMAFQRFIDTKLIESIDDIFYAINQFIISIDDVDTSVIHVDGTKIEANATKFSFVWKKAVLKHRERLYIKISKLFEEPFKHKFVETVAKETYTPEDLDSLILAVQDEINTNRIAFVYGKGKPKHPLQRTYEAAIEYQGKLREYDEHIKICGDRNSYSKTDHDATFMHGKEDYYSKSGIFKPYYNLQIGVSDEYIIHYGVFPNPTDTKTWIPFFDSYKERYQMLPDKPVADAGYGSYDNYMDNIENNMALTMKYNMFSKEDEPKFKKKLYNVKNMEKIDNTFVSSDGHIFEYSHDNEERRGNYLQVKQIYKHTCWDESLKELGIPKSVTYDVVLFELQKEAKKTLKSDEGNQLRIQRSIQVEGAFGEIKSNTNYNRIQRRTKTRVKQRFAWC